MAILRNILISLALCALTTAESFKDAIDGIEKMMTGRPEFSNPDFYQEFVGCLNSIDPTLLQSVGSQWDGMISYAASGGDPVNGDPWPQCDGSSSKWFEYNCTVQEYGDMLIFEPCNYASNLAYYHTVTEICGHSGWSLPIEDVNAMAKTFAILGQGSSFWHGSETSNGGSADVRINDLFAYVAYQAAVKNLVPSDSSIIHELSTTPRAKSANEITDFFVDMYINVPVEEWGGLLESEDFPSLRLGMCGYFGTALTMLYPPDVVDSVVEYLLGLFTDIPEDLKVFCLQEFLPEIRTATVSLNMTHDEFITFEADTIGTVFKLLYAFLWQEEVLTTDDIFLQPATNELGAVLIPVINGLVNGVNSFDYTDVNNMQAGLKMYPGEAWCNLVIPHAKWHVQTGIALTDFVFLTDEMYRLLSK